MVSDRFRWVFCQLDTLRRCMPSSIRKTLNELPTTLDDTYERTLQEIPKEKWQHAHRLLQCLTAASRPLRVEELAEIFTIEFDLETTPNLMEGWRPEDPQEAVLSACSTLITIINNRVSKIVQFSHFSVKEFLTSDRLRTSKVGDIARYHFPLVAAHTILAGACLTVLLQFDENTDNNHLARFPLASYAAQHWVDHAKFEDVAMRIEDAMKRLFDPNKPYLTAWTRIHNMDVDRVRVRETIGALTEHPMLPGATSLYHAASCGFSQLAKHLIVKHAEDANAGCGYHGNALYAALYTGHVDTARVLLDHGADMNLKDRYGEIPLVAAYHRRNLEVMRLLLELGASADVRYGPFGLLSHHTSYHGQAEVMQLLLEYEADVNAKANGNWTPLYCASREGHAKVVQLLLEYGADVNAQSTFQNTPLHGASEYGHLEVARILLEHGADVRILGENGRTAFQVAERWGHAEIAQLLLEHGAETEEE